MLSLFLFICAVIFTVGHLTYKREWHSSKAAEVFLAYVLLFSMGIMSLFAAYAHVFMGPEIANLIGWPARSPFQFEMGMANLSYGVLGVLAFWIRGRFWEASIIGWSVLLLGCFVGHVIDYYANHNTAPYNIGPYIWFYDLFLPILILSLLLYTRSSKQNYSRNKQ